MKLRYLVLVLMLTGCKPVVTPPPPPPPLIGIPLSITCPTGEACGEYNIYRRIGECPSSLTDSTGWTLVGTTINATFLDVTVVPGITYSYDAEGVEANTSSGPSNCISGSSN